MRSLWAVAIRLLLLLAVAIFLFNAILLGLAYQAYGIIALLGVTYHMTRPRWRASGSHGTARVSGLGDLLAGRLLCRHGLVLGRAGQTARPTKGQALRALFWPGVPSEWAVRQFCAAFFRSRQAGDFIRINDFVHLATFAPAGGGKSVSTLVPNLLSYSGNCVIIDPKGELYRLTARHRRKVFGHRIVRLDPALMLGPGADRFNPFDGIDPRSRDFIGQCRDIANMMVVRTGQEHDPHFNESAENAIAAFIAYICALEGNPACRNPRGMRAQLASRANYEAALDIMRQHEGFFGVLEQLSQSLSWHVDRELGSVMSTAQRHSKVFDEPLVDDATCASTFDPRELRTGRMTVYLIVPGDRLVVWAALLRVWLGCLMRIITRVPTERNPVLFLVDETAHIGRMQVLEDAFTLLRGYGIRMWVFFQSIEQLKKCFGDNAGTVLDNIATQQYFSINSYETAETLSKRMGEETMVIRTDSGNSGVSSPVGGDGKNPGSRSSGTSWNTSEIARRLLKPEEILTLPEQTAIIFHKNNYVILCNKIKYYADRAFRQRGILFRRFGTGRARGLGIREMLLAIALLAVSLLAALVAAELLPSAGDGYLLP
jgi:type IV secretion system protein VirD4